MTGRQLLEWQAYSEVEPFGQERADLRLASILRMLFSINRDTEKVPEVPGLGEFYASFLAEVQSYLRPPDEKPPGIAKKQTWQEQKLKLLEFAAQQAAIHLAEQQRAAVREARKRS